MSQARHLRQKATPHERILWRRLRNRQFANWKFRRQHPINPYILDFYCPEARIAIELDGGGHNYDEKLLRDQARTEFLAREGIIVLRFRNEQICLNLDSVRETIWFALKERCKRNPSPQSSPLARGEADWGSQMIL